MGAMLLSSRARRSSRATAINSAPHIGAYFVGRPAYNGGWQIRHI